MTKRGRNLIQIMLLLITFSIFLNMAESKELTPGEKLNIKRVQEEKILKKIKKFEGKTAEELREIIISGNPSDKEWGARALARREDIGLDKKLEILRFALGKEITAPTSEEFLMGALIPITETIKRQYVFAFIDLGEKIIPHLENFIRDKREDNEFRERMVIAMGNLKNQKYLKELLEISVKSQNPYIRASSISALHEGELYKFASREMLIEYVKEWVKDPYYIKPKSDFSPDTEWIVYPVRDAAITILLNLDINFKRDKNEIHILSK